MSIFGGKSRRGLRSALGAPATPQQVITSKGFLDRKVVAQRIRNSQDSRLASQSYGGGGILDHHTIKPHDVTVALRRQRHVQKLLNHPNVHCLASFNGERYADLPTDYHIQRAYRFSGVALQTEGYTGNRADSGLALQVGGIYTVLNSGPHDLKPGMQACWRVPPTGRGVGGVAMNELPMAAWNPGEPRGKLPPLIMEYQPRDATMVLRGAYHTVFRSANLNDDASPGIRGLPFQNYYRQGIGRFREMRYNTNHQDEGMAVKYGFLPMALMVVYGLVKAGKLRSATGSADAGGIVRDIVSWCGLYKENATDLETDRLRLLLSYSMWKHIDDQVVQDAVTNQYVQDFRGGFRAATGAPNGNYGSLDGNIALNFQDAPNILFGGIIGAYHEDQDCIIGVVQNEARSGEGVAINFGALN